MDEFLALLTGKGLSLPPEFIPALLDRGARDGAFFEKIRPATGPLGEWLAAQNPAWSALYEQPEQNWDNGAFAERLRWLTAARKKHPLVALTQLEKTWRSERPEHKIQFLRTFQSRLSVLDESFLEKILNQEKRRELRQTALIFLLKIPGSRLQTWLGEFFRERLAGVFSAPDLDRFLKKQLPDLEEPPAPMLVAALPEAEVKHWRPALAAFLIAHLPPSETLGAPSPESFQTLIRMADSPEYQGLFRGLAQAAATFSDGAWQEVLLRFQEKYPDSYLWDHDSLGALLSALPPARQNSVLTRLLAQKDALMAPNTLAVRHLETFSAPWTLGLLQAFAAQISSMAYPLPHLRELLASAAYHCLPVDAESVRSFLHPERMPAWRYELAQFYDVVHFRRRMHAAFEK